MKKVTTIGTQLVMAELRSATGLIISELARELGITQLMVSGFKQGELRMKNIELIDRIADLLVTDIYYIFGILTEQHIPEHLGAKYAKLIQKELETIETNDGE